ncbi:hypothetical protein DWY54_09620 [Parabacteroides distasonis]|jgi:hypothetical protein|nr:hypothetical protein DWY54_09620 [Parabacteroides distasonis]UVY41565.1 MAG: hypothetical protein [Bacteriophage sp.]
MIIDNAYFKGDLRIQGLVIPEDGGFSNEASNAISENVVWYIETYGDEYLVSLMGGYYDSFVDYADNGRKGNDMFDYILGILRSNRSPMAMYVYFHYQRNETLISVSSTSDDVDVRRILVHTSRMMTQAWNNMVDINIGISDRVRESFKEDMDIDRNILTHINEMNI